MIIGGPILVAEDDEDIRDIIVFILRERGYDAIGATDGLHALRLMSTGPTPALLLVDLMMPRLSGTELATRMRATPALASIPIVVLSGDLAAREVGAELGACATLVKPVDLDDLLDVVDRCASFDFEPRQPIHNP